MKLLTWIHRKFRQGNTEILKEFTLGQPLLDNHVYQKQNHGSGAVRQVHKDTEARKSFITLETTSLGDLEDASTEFHEFFEGFLAIGTLGTDAVTSEPQTPTFAESFEKLAERDSEVTENELRLINDELEKVLAEAEAKEDCWTDSSGRNSQVSNGRISHASSITLGGKTLEISETIVPGNLTSPLQGYLLGSAVELQEKTPAKKKQNRTSLAELFERHKAEETCEAKCKEREKREESKEGEKPAMNLIKKILKKKTGSSPRSSSTSAETKLCKILQKFQRKVHPECLTSKQKSERSRKIRIKDIIPCNSGYYKEKDGHKAEDESMTNLSEIASKNNYAPQNKGGFNRTQSVAEGGDSNGSRECWIKSDADYLVLEL